MEDRKAILPWCFLDRIAKTRAIKPINNPNSMEMYNTIKTLMTTRTNPQIDPSLYHSGGEIGSTY